MRLVLLLASVAVVSILAAPSARAQHATDLLPSTSLSAELAAPRLSVLAPSQARASTSATYATGLERRRIAGAHRGGTRRSGALGGALAGAGFGTVLMVRSDEWIAAPAHIFTVPGGALLGAAIGGLMNLVIRR